MHYFYWISGTILALAWLSRIIDAAIGMPSVADVSKPEWDRDPVSASGNPRVSVIVPARNEEADIEQRMEILGRALEDYSPRAHAVLMMYRCEGLTLKEIGGRLGVSSVMARKYLMSAIKYCHQHLDGKE